MTFDIPSEYEKVLNQLVANGAFPSTESALRHALQLLAGQQAASARLNGTQSTQAMPKRIDIEELAKEQNAAVFDASKLVPVDVWPSDESADDFIVFISESRKDILKPGAHR